MTDLKYQLNINKHVSHGLHYDDLAIVNELHLLMKGRRNGIGSMDPRSAQKQVKGGENPQNLEYSDKCSWTYQ